MTYVAIAIFVCWMLSGLLTIEYKRTRFVPPKPEELVAINAVTEALVYVLLAWVIFFR